MHVAKHGLSLIYLRAAKGLEIGKEEAWVRARKGLLGQRVEGLKDRMTKHTQCNYHDGKRDTVLTPASKKCQ